MSVYLIFPTGEYVTVHRKIRHKAGLVKKNFFFALLVCQHPDIELSRFYNSSLTVADTTT